MQTKAKRLVKHRNWLYAHFKLTPDIIWVAETSDEYKKQAHMAEYKAKFHPKMPGEPCIEAIRLYNSDKNKIHKFMSEPEDGNGDLSLVTDIT